MANMFWNLDKISETTAIHSGFRLCPIISHSSMRLTMPVAFIFLNSSCGVLFLTRIVSAGFFSLFRAEVGFIWQPNFPIRAHTARMLVQIVTKIQIA